MIELIRSARMPGQDVPVDVWIGADGSISRVTPAGAGGSTAPDGAINADATIDADGRVLTSGLWDEHIHFGQWSQQQSRPDFVDCDSAEEALEQVRTFLLPDVAGNVPDELIGMRLRGGDWGGVTAEQLDSVSGDIPVILIGLDLHGAWLNSAALRRHGFAPGRSAHVVETECFALVSELDRISDEGLDALILAAGRKAAALGVVGVVDLEIRWAYDDWVRRERSGFDMLRVEAGIYPEHFDRAIELGLTTGSPIGAGGLVSVGPIKVITDGSLGTRTAWCCDPYPDGGHGIELVSPGDLEALLRKVEQHGFTAAVHAIGDRANTQALDAFASTGAKGSIEHAQLINPADIKRFAELGVTASMQPAHMLDDIPSMTKVWGEKAKYAFPLRSLLAAGARVAFGSDAPVAPLDPWLEIQAAVTRSRRGAPAWEPDELVTPAQALACSMRGPLRPGAGDRADLVLLESDPLEGEYTTPRVAATLVGGRVTYRAGELG